jgi:hypothetical protein
VNKVFFLENQLLDFQQQKKKKKVSHQWLTPVILATQEAEIRRIEVHSQPRQMVYETLSQKNPSQKKGWWSGLRYRP